MYYLHSLLSLHAIFPTIFIWGPLLIRGSSAHSCCKSFLNYSLSRMNIVECYVWFESKLENTKTPFLFDATCFLIEVEFYAFLTCLLSEVEFQAFL